MSEASEDTDSTVVSQEATIDPQECDENLREVEKLYLDSKD